jgi:hypothetical protein
MTMKSTIRRRNRTKDVARLLCRLTSGNIAMTIINIYGSIFTVDLAANSISF